MGLPFALSPTGDLRWRAPVPVEKGPVSTQLIDATKPGNQCVQGGGLLGGTTQQGGIAGINTDIVAALNITVAAETPVESEDCLRLDVIVPQTPKSDSLPVVVAIHGGGHYSQSTLPLEEGPS